MGRHWKGLSDFILNATEEEKREVYEIVMERAAMRQREAFRMDSKCHACGYEWALHRAHDQRCPAPATNGRGWTVADTVWSETPSEVHSK